MNIYINDGNNRFFSKLLILYHSSHKLNSIQEIRTGSVYTSCGI